MCRWEDLTSWRGWNKLVGARAAASTNSQRAFRFSTERQPWQTDTEIEVVARECDLQERVQNLTCFSFLASFTQSGTQQSPLNKSSAPS